MRIYHMDDFYGPNPTKFETLICDICNKRLIEFGAPWGPRSHLSKEHNLPIDINIDWNDVYIKQRMIR